MTLYGEVPENQVKDVIRLDEGNSPFMYLDTKEEKNGVRAPGQVTVGIGHLLANESSLKNKLLIFKFKHDTIDRFKFQRIEGKKRKKSEPPFEKAEAGSKDNRLITAGKEADEVYILEEWRYLNEIEANHRNVKASAFDKLTFLVMGSGEVELLFDDDVKGKGYGNINSILEDSAFQPLKCYPQSAQKAMLTMAFNLSPSKIKGFKKMFANILVRNFNGAPMR